MSAVTFLRSFIADPVTIGAVAPSGRSLASLMVEAAEIRPGHVVVELGAGSGPMTEALLAKHPENPLLVLEPVPELAATLRARFPKAEVREAWAQDLGPLVTDWGHTQVDRVVSSLPWAIWKPELQDTIFNGIFKALAPDARLVTFTYWHAQPLPAARRFRETLAARFHTVTRTRVAWANLPPAFVFVCDGPRERKIPQLSGPTSASDDSPQAE